MTSSTTPKTILLAGKPIAYESAAAAEITPGAALIVGATAALATAGSETRAFARENELVGKGIDDAYATGDRVLYYVCSPGDRVYAWLAEDEDVAAGAALSIGASGELVAADPGDPDATPPEYATPVIARALEAVAATGDAARNKVEIV